MICIFFIITRFSVGVKVRGWMDRIGLRGALRLRERLRGCIRISRCRAAVSCSVREQVSDEGQGQSAISGMNIGRAAVFLDIAGERKFSTCFFGTDLL